MKLKKALSLTLALAMCLAMAVPAFAASVQVDTPYSYVDVRLSDVTSTSTAQVHGSWNGDATIPFYVVPVGSSMSLYGYSGMGISKCSLGADGAYTGAGNVYSDEDGFDETLTIVWDEMYANDIWWVSVWTVYGDGFLVKVEGTSIPTEPKPVTVRVRFDSEWGSSVSDKTVTVGQPYGDLPTPTRTGYTFDGWYTDPTVGSKVTAVTMVAESKDHTLYAHWNSGKFEQFGDRFATDKASTGTVTKEIDGKMQTVRLYPEGTVFSWKGPSANQGFGTVSIVGDRYLGAYFDTFTLKNDGIYYISIEGEVVYAMADTSAQPEQPVQKPGSAVAAPTNDKLTMDGKLQNPTVLKLDGGDNYFKIRDLAAMLNGTSKQFSVGYDGSVQVTTGQPYTPVGGELAGPATATEIAEPSNDVIYINGEKANLTAFKVGGNNFFRLRDLGKALDFYVGWTAERGVFIETDKPYGD